MTTVIKTKNSTTTTSAPSSLAQGELAVNITDKKLWVGNAATTPIQLLGAGADLSLSTATLSGNLTLSGGTANGVLYLNGSKVATSGSALTYNGSQFQLSGAGGVAGASDLFYLNVTSSYGGMTLNATSGNNTFVELYQAGTTKRGEYGLDSTNSLVNIGGFNGYGLKILTNGNEVARFDTSGNLGLGVTPSVWGGNYKVLQNSAGFIANYQTGSFITGQNYYDSGIGAFKYVNNGYATSYEQANGAFSWKTAPSGTAGTTPSFTQAMTLDNSGNLLVGITAKAVSSNTKIETGGTEGAAFRASGGTSSTPLYCWNDATTGNNSFVQFLTDAGGQVRGTITYNRGLGLTAYNTTSDYRAKDILGEITNSGEVVDQIKVHLGQMHGATQSRPMFIAHELAVPAPYCVTGEKDALNEKGEPIYQQVDHTPLIPLLVAELQSLRKRVATLEGK